MYIIQSMLHSVALWKALRSVNILFTIYYDFFVCLFVVDLWLGFFFCFILVFAFVFFYYFVTMSFSWLVGWLVCQRDYTVGIFMKLGWRMGPSQE